MGHIAGSDSDTTGKQMRKMKSMLRKEVDYQTSSSESSLPSQGSSVEESDEEVNSNVDVFH